MKLRIAAAVGVTLPVLALQTVAPAHAITLDPTKLVKDFLPVLTGAKVDVHNHYPFPIKVVMDSDRENHVIAPGGVATFTKPNKLDRPTFYAMRLDDGAVINTKQVFLDVNKTVNFGQ